MVTGEENVTNHGKVDI